MKVLIKNLRRSKNLRSSKSRKEAIIVKLIFQKNLSTTCLNAIS